MLNDDYLFTNIGIDSIGFYAPRYYVSLDELAKERGIDPDKYRIGLLSREMRLPELDEDIISMGLKAGYNALIRGGINPKDIDAVFVGTETMTYAVKSVSNIFGELLGISENSISQDIYNACAAGTLALLNAIALIEKGIISKALVICTDISSYHIGSPGEPTQGSGAVAFIISNNPRIAKFSKRFGKVSGNINDFFRVGGETEAQVFGQYSVDSYLNFQLRAYDDLTDQIGDFASDYYIFHAPFSKLPLKCMQQIILKRWLNNVNFLFKFKTREKRFSLGISKKLDSLIQSASIIPEFVYSKLRARGLSLSRLNKISNWFKFNVKNMVLPQLKIPMLFGNLYSASLWAQVIYILENHAQENETLYFGSYGSGAVCLSGLIKVNPSFKEVIEKGPRMNDFIENKKHRSIKEYEMMRTGVLKPEIMIGRISEHKENNGRGFFLYFCDHGCLIPNFKGLNYCPKGHSGFHKRFFPLYAVLETIPKEFSAKDPSFLLDNLVRVSPVARKGNIMEYEIRRIEFSNEDNLNVKGLLNWSPCYVPIGSKWLVPSF